MLKMKYMLDGLLKKKAYLLEKPEQLLTKRHKEMKIVDIYFIKSPNCPVCAKSIEILNKAIEKSGRKCNVKFYIFDPEKNEDENMAAIMIASNNDIDDVPGFMVGNKENVFKGTNFTEEDVVRAIKSIK